MHNLPPLRGLVLLIALSALIAACRAPQPIPTAAPTGSAPTQESSVIDAASGLIREGQRFVDPVDTEPAFLDVIGFTVTVDEAADQVQAVFELREIPEDKVLRNQYERQVFEYSWNVQIYTRGRDESGLSDYLLSAYTTNIPGLTRSLDPAPHEVEFAALFDQVNVTEQQIEGRAYLGYTRAGAFDIDFERDTLTLTAIVPEISSDALFLFSTGQYDAGQDDPQIVHVTEAPDDAPTAAPTDSPTPAAASLIPTPFADSDQGSTWAFPSPPHYEGDVIDLIFKPGIDVYVEEIPVRVQIDSQQEFRATAINQFVGLALPGVYDTTGQAGQHTITVTGTDAGVEFAVRYRFTVLPADQRPTQEVNAEWLTHEIDCCVLKYLSATAAARDIDLIAEQAQSAVDEVQAASGMVLDRPFEIVLIDRMWGNAAFGGGGVLVIAYTDRYYGPNQGLSGLATVLRHEATHALGADFNGTLQFLFAEGMAVYYAGGHYKPEPLPARGAALLELGWYSPLEQSAYPNHEAAYLQQAVLVKYLIDTVGKDGFERFRQYHIEGEEFPQMDAWMRGAILEATGLSLADFETQFIAWLESHASPDQVVDLRLTVELQALRRQYQASYAPYPQSIFGDQDEVFRTPDQPYVVMREPSTPLNIAFEVVIMHAQQAIIDARYDEAEALIDVLREAIIDGSLDADPLADYTAIAEMLANQGYEAVDIRIDGDTATVQAIRVHPKIETLMLIGDGGAWVIEE